MHSRSFWQCRSSRGGKRRGSSAVALGKWRESPTLARNATATTGARALSRRKAHAKNVSPSLGVARPVATQLTRRGATLCEARGARGETLPSNATARSDRSGTRSFLEALGAGTMRLASRYAERCGGAGEDRMPVVVSARRLKCVAEIGRRCPDPEKLEPGTFLTKTRARVNGGLT